MALRRRARRRLVGAVAIALAAVVVLPMLFDPEPKPLGSEVDIRIPAKDTPFDAAPGAPAATAPTLANEPASREAEPTVQPPAPAPAKPVTEASDKTALAETTAPKPAEAKPVDTKAERTAEKETTKAEKTAADTKAGKKAAETAKTDAKADVAFASKGYFLQLGAFSSETNAKHLLEKAQAAGFKVALSSGNGQYRVRVGPFPEHAKALEVQAKLKAKGFSPVLIGP